MGAVTVTVSEYYVEGNHQVRRGGVTMSNSYTTGGDSFTAAQFGLNNIVKLMLLTTQNANNTAQGYAAAHITATSQQSGTIQLFGDGGNAPGAPLVEAASGTNNTGIIISYLVWGY